VITFAAICELIVAALVAEVVVDSLQIPTGSFSLYDKIPNGRIVIMESFIDALPATYFVITASRLQMRFTPVRSPSRDTTRTRSTQPTPAPLLSSASHPKRDSLQ
jgi:hypothetical protein